MPDNQFKARCPKCYSDDHVKYRLRIPFSHIPMPGGAMMLDVAGDTRHCHACGLKFSATSAVEMREVPMVEPPQPEQLTYWVDLS